LGGSIYKGSTVIINYTWWMFCFKEGRFYENFYKEGTKDIGNREIEVITLVEGKSH